MTEEGKTQREVITELENYLNSEEATIEEKKSIWLIKKDSVEEEKADIYDEFFFVESEIEGEPGKLERIGSMQIDFSNITDDAVFTKTVTVTGTLTANGGLVIDGKTPLTTDHETAVVTQDEKSYPVHLDYTNADILNNLATNKTIDLGTGSGSLSLANGVYLKDSSTNPNSTISTSLASVNITHSAGDTSAQISLSGVGAMISASDEDGNSSTLNLTGNNTFTYGARLKHEDNDGATLHNYLLETDVVTTVAASNDNPVSSGAVYTAIQNATPNISGNKGITVTDGSDNSKIIELDPQYFDVSDGVKIITSSYIPFESNTDGDTTAAVYVLDADTLDIPDEFNYFGVKFRANSGKPTSVRANVYEIDASLLPITGGINQKQMTPIAKSINVQNFNSVNNEWKTWFFDTKIKRSQGKAIVIGFNRFDSIGIDHTENHDVHCINDRSANDKSTINGTNYNRQITPRVKFGTYLASSDSSQKYDYIQISPFSTDGGSNLIRIKISKKHISKVKGKIKSISLHRRNGSNVSMQVSQDENFGTFITSKNTSGVSQNQWDAFQFDPFEVDTSLPLYLKPSSPAGFQCQSANVPADDDSYVEVTAGQFNWIVNAIIEYEEAEEAPKVIPTAPVTEELDTSATLLHQHFYHASTEGDGTTLDISNITIENNGTIELEIDYNGGTILIGENWIWASERPDNDVSTWETGNKYVLAMRYDGLKTIVNIQYVYELPVESEEVTE